MVYDEKKEKEDILKYNYSETQNHLFETGIQNIFNQYNKQIASLEAGKQKQIDDAYYIKELSKKYLGEYASNVGVGDVSGQLLDIYGKYQENIDVINQYYQQLQTGLESSYEQQKSEYEIGLLEAQYNLEQERVGEERTNLANEIIFNIQKGEIPEEYKSGAEYIEANRAILGNSYAWELLFKNYEFEQQKEAISRGDKANEIIHNLRTGLNLGGLTSSEYLEENKDILGPELYWEAKIDMTEGFISENVQSALNNIMKYNTQEEWDAYVDKLYSDNKIGKEHANFLKDSYITTRKGGFTMAGSEDASEMSYFAPKNLNIAPGGDVYVGFDKSTMLGETTTHIVSGGDFFNELDDFITDKESGKKTHGLNELILYGKDYYVKKLDENGEPYFVKYAIIPAPEQNEYQNTYKEGAMYDMFKESLGENSGVINTSSGLVSVKYENGEYKPYMFFEASNVGKNKGNFLINGSTYTINNKNNEGKKAVLVGVDENEYNNAIINKDFVKAAKIMEKNGLFKKFADLYYGGDSYKLWEDVHKKDNSSAKTVVVLYNNKYYTFNNGVFRELERKEE